jgi:hypothetical protein
MRELCTQYQPIIAAIATSKAKIGIANCGFFSICPNPTRRTGSLFFWRDRIRKVDFVADSGGRIELFETKWTELPSEAHQSIRKSANANAFFQNAFGGRNHVAV